MGSHGQHLQGDTRHVRHTGIKTRSARLHCLLMVISQLVAVTGEPQWDVDRLIRARNPGAVFTTTERVDVTWQTLRSITYSPTLQQGAVGSASVQEASLVRSFKNPDSKSGCSQSVVSAYLCVWLVSLSL